MRFIDRKAELNELNAIEKLSRKKLFVVAVYGLRRVGKTRLLLEFLKERGLYFFVNRNKTSDDLLLELQESNPGLIILAGSLIGLMKKTFQNSKEPLYGRIKRGIRTSPLDLPSCFEIGEELNLKRAELLKLYLLFGGYPKYYTTIEDFDLKGKTALEIVDALFLSKSAPLDEEVSMILSQEFGRRSGIYYSILEAIALGNNRLSAIAGYLNVPATSITRQIGDLKD